MDITKLQRSLTSQGYDTGPLDGIWGRLTSIAVQNFQTRHGLRADGVMTEDLERQILTAESGTQSGGLVWMDEALRLMGTREVVGRGSNPTILDWASDLGIPYQGDDIPWCGLFAAHCIGATLPNEPLPRNPLGAREWIKFGRPLDTPVEGAILVFWRGSRDGWEGHVAFCTGQDREAYHVIGGNQSDTVSRARIAKDRLLGARWPASASGLVGKVVERTATGELSRREA